MSSPQRKLSREVAASLIVALAAVLLVGCGSSSSSSSTGASTPSASGPTASSTAATATAPGVSTGAQGTQPAGTSKTSTGASSSGSVAPATPSSGGRLLRKFAGDGPERLGTVIVSVPSTLVWRADHPPIQIFTSSGFMLVNSQAASGAMRLSRGSYRGVRVASRAGWTIELRSQS
jgi:hypothetical protein